MLLDTFLSHQQKIYLAMITASIWIYYRTFDCYALLQRKKVISILLVILWIYLYNRDPLFLPIGMAIMFAYKSLLGVA